VRACFLSLSAEFKGHHSFQIVAADTAVDVPSLTLARRFYPGVPIRGDFTGNCSFFSCAKATRLLGY
jgi:UDP-glucose 4-epimerase